MRTITIRGLAVTAAIVLLAASAVATATSVSRIRIGSHPAFVRVVVDLVGPVSASDVAYRPASARFSVGLGRARSPRLHAAAAGVVADVAASTKAPRLAVSAPGLAGGYVAITVLSGPRRVVVDVVRPYSATALTIGRCLVITSVRSSARAVDVRGRVAAGVFESQWVLALRDRSGRIVARRSITHGPGAFAYRLTHHAATQSGDVDAYDLSAKDGSLACLARVPVTLRR
jgi:hypothetical protein